MALSRRRVTWEYTPEYTWLAKLYADQAQKVLDDFCDRWPQWYADPLVTGEALGFVQFSITVLSRDQWWVGRRANRILSALRVYYDFPVAQVTVVSSDRLPPHDHRGKTYLKEVRDGGTHPDPHPVS